MPEPLEDAAPPDLPALARGTNASEMRALNERLVLSLVRRHGALPKSEIARLTGLSAQTASVITRSLEADGLLQRGAPLRGRVGQPSVPLSLDPDGAYFLGAKIGRRSADLVLVDFLGRVREHRTRAYPFPVPEAVLDFLAQGIAAIEAGLGERAGRLAGLGLAMPFEIWNWIEQVGAPPALMQRWRDVDLRATLAARLAYPVYVQNDATAACAAELAFGAHRHLVDFAYLYVGTFVGGGIVLRGSVYSGPSGNAGAFGSLLVPEPGSPPRQLIDHASLILLERAVGARGADPAALAADGAAVWASHEAAVGPWLERAAHGLAHAIAAATAVIDCPAAVIDGPFPPPVHERLLAATRRELARLDLPGVAPPRVLRGSIGPLARALGGASLPLFDRYLTDPEPLRSPA